MKPDPCNSIVHKLGVLALMVLALAGSVSSQESGAFAGRWRHDQGRSDPHYLGPEYPGRWMRVSVAPERVEVEQALGGVENGFPIAGSGDAIAVWSLPTDGTVHDVTTGAMTRSMSAVWTEGHVLEIRYTISHGDDGEMRGVERWRTFDEGASLEIERSLTFGELEKTRRIVFRREEESPAARPGEGGR